MEHDEAGLLTGTFTYHGPLRRAHFESGWLHGRDEIWGLGLREGEFHWVHGMPSRSGPLVGHEGKQIIRGASWKGGPVLPSPSATHASWASGDDARSSPRLRDRFPARRPHGTAHHPASRQGPEPRRPRPHRRPRLDRRRRQPLPPRRLRTGRPRAGLRHPRGRRGAPSRPVRCLLPQRPQPPPRAHQPLPLVRRRWAGARHLVRRWPGPLPEPPCGDAGQGDGGRGGQGHLARGARALRLLRAAGPPSRTPPTPTSSTSRAS